MASRAIKAFMVARKEELKQQQQLQQQQAKKKTDLPSIPEHIDTSTTPVRSATPRQPTRDR